MGNIPEALPVDKPWIGAVASYYKPGAVLVRKALKRFIINFSCIIIGFIGDHPVILAGTVYRAAMSEMASMGQVHAHHHVSRADKRLIDGVIGCSARQGLHVDKDILHGHLRSGKALRNSLLCQGFYEINIFNALIVPAI